LVAVLRQQHQAGRKLTDVILRNTLPDNAFPDDAQQETARACQTFIRMYRPHAAREDTVQFPALYGLLGGKAVKELGEQFEETEHKLFSEGGFASTVDEVAAIEKQLGIYDLTAFTPK
jgi:hemerythrin-like domain-containing protein